MSTPTIEQIKKHGSVRKYRPDAVSAELVNEIVAAGQRASTSSNLQTFSVVVSKDPVKKKVIQEICSGQTHLSEAPVFLLWCADFSRLSRICQHQGFEIDAGYMENFMVGIVDAAIASQNSALAAESLGLGICYIGAIRNDPKQIRELFDLPDLVFPVFGMTLGWPVDPPLQRPRLPLEAVLHTDSYQQDDLTHLKDYDQQMIETGIYGGRQVGKNDQSPEIYGWMEHSSRRSSKPSRPHLKESIIESGFLLK